MSSSPWIETPAFDVDLDAPLSARVRTVPEPLRRQARTLLEAVMAELPGKALMLADAVRLRTAGRFQAEAKQLGRATGAGWRSIVLAGIAYDLAMSTYGCSTLALATADGPVLARNMDWWPEDLLARASCRQRYHRGGRTAWIDLGWPGAIGAVTGLSARGFALALNAVCGPEGVSWRGYPVMLHLRRVLEDATGFDDAVRRLAGTRLAAPALITVVGTENHQRVVVERSPARHALRRPDGGKPLVTTNDYRLLFTTEARGAPQLVRTACARFDALRRLFAGHDPAGPVEDERLLYALTDPSVIQGITAQHAIMRPAREQARLFVPRRFLA